MHNVNWHRRSMAREATTPRGRGGTASLRVGTPNKTTDPRFYATTALFHYPCWFAAPCFEASKDSLVLLLLLLRFTTNRHTFSVILMQLS